MLLRMCWTRTLASSPNRTTSLRGTACAPQPLTRPRLPPVCDTAPMRGGARFLDGGARSVRGGGIAAAAGLPLPMRPASTRPLDVELAAGATRAGFTPRIAAENHDVAVAIVRRRSAPVAANEATIAEAVAARAAEPGSGEVNATRKLRTSAAVRWEAAARRSAASCRCK